MMRILAALVFLALLPDGTAFAQGKASCEGYCTKRCAQYPAGGKGVCMSKCIPACHQNKKK